MITNIDERAGRDLADSPESTEKAELGIGQRGLPVRGEDVRE
jgi:hypothetical protein